jgi:hypothetical protein
MSSSPVRVEWTTHRFASRDKCYLRCDSTVKPARPETSPTHSHANCCAAEPYTSLRIAPSVRRYAAYSQHRRGTGLAGKRRRQWRPAARYDLQAMVTPRGATERRQAAQPTYEAARRCAATYRYSGLDLPERRVFIPTLPWVRSPTREPHGRSKARRRPRAAGRPVLGLPFTLASSSYCGAWHQQ